MESCVYYIFILGEIPSGRHWSIKQFASKHKVCECIWMWRWFGIAVVHWPGPITRSPAKSWSQGPLLQMQLYSITIHVVSSPPSPPQNPLSSKTKRTSKQKMQPCLTFWKSNALANITNACIKRHVAVWLNKLLSLFYAI